MLANFSGVEFQKTISKFRKRKRKSLSCVHVFEKREFRHFLVVVMQRRQRNVQKAWCTCKVVVFANINLLLFFCRSRCRRPRRCLSSLCGRRREEEPQQSTACRRFFLFPLVSPSCKMTRSPRLAHKVIVMLQNRPFYSCVLSALGPFSRKSR